MSEFNRRLLRRMTSMLPAGNAVEQINAIVERPDAEAYLRALDPEVFYHLIKEAGWDQGVDLIPYASPAQLQSFVDLDVWRRDRFIPARLDRWLDVLINEASDERFKRAMREMDAEVAVMYLKEFIDVMEPDEEGRIPDEAPDAARLSPDGMHVIVYPEDEDREVLVRALLHRLYELDRVLAWTVLEGVRWELSSEMEEYALRWRTSRLEEMGFVSRVEALQVYRLIDPSKLRERLELSQAEPLRVHVNRTTLDLPAVLKSELREEFFFVRMLSTIESPALFHEKSFELGVLMNKVMIADGIEPGELGSGRQVIRRALGYLSLALEFLSRGDEPRARQLIAEAPYRELFRLGFSLLYALQRQVRQLMHRPTLTLLESQDASLLGDEDAALCEGLMRQRPTYGLSPERFELFESQRQLDEAALRLSRLAFKQIWWFALQRVTIEELVALATSEDRLGEATEVTFEAMMATWVAREILEGRGQLKPLDAAELERLLPRIAQRPWRLKSSPREHFSSLFERLAPLLLKGTGALFESWLDDTLARLEDELGAISRVDQEVMRALTGVVLLRRDA